MFNLFDNMTETYKMMVKTKDGLCEATCTRSIATPAQSIAYELTRNKEVNCSNVDSILAEAKFIYESYIAHQSQVNEKEGNEIKHPLDTDKCGIKNKKEQ